MLESQMRWEIGPYHAALGGAYKLKFLLNGEKISSCEVETGYLQRGIEKVIESQPWLSAVAYLDHIDPESALFYEWAFCAAVEDLSNLQVPKRAQSVRMILAELTRVCCSLKYLARMAELVGAYPLMHSILLDREKAIDLFELLTGARFSLNFLRVGGISKDVTEGFLERVYEYSRYVAIRAVDYQDLFIWSSAFKKRTENIGYLRAEDIILNDVTGPNARASGLNIDLRRSSPLYSGLDVVSSLDRSLFSSAAVGSVYARVFQRFIEIGSSLEILKTIVEKIPLGDYLNPLSGQDLKISHGESVSQFESARGSLYCYVCSDGGPTPYRVSFKTPSFVHIKVVPSILMGAEVEDLPLILASLDLCIAEVDK